MFLNQRPRVTARIQTRMSSRLQCISCIGDDQQRHTNSMKIGYSIYNWQQCFYSDSIILNMPLAGLFIIVTTAFLYEKGLIGC